MKKLVLAVALTTVAMPSHAQEHAATNVELAGQVSAPVAAIVETPGQENIVRSGTEIALAMREELTTKGKKLKVGQRFQMEVAADVLKNGVVVIPSGTPAVGEITEVRNKGMWGKSGYIGAQAVSIRLGNRNIRLTGSFDDKGVTGTAGVVAAIALIPVAGFFTTGTSAVIPMGSQAKAFLDEDVAFVPVATQAPPVEVPVTVSTAVVQTTSAATPVEVASAEKAEAPAAPASNRMPAGVTCVTCQ